MKVPFLLFLALTTIQLHATTLKSVVCKQIDEVDPYHIDGSERVFELKAGRDGKFALYVEAYALPAATDNRELVERGVLASNLNCSVSSRNPRLVGCERRDDAGQIVESVHLKDVYVNRYDLQELEVQSAAISKSEKNTLDAFQFFSIGLGHARTNMPIKANANDPQGCTVTVE